MRTVSFFLPKLKANAGTFKNLNSDQIFEFRTAYNDLKRFKNHYVRSFAAIEFYGIINKTNTDYLAKLLAIKAIRKGIVL